MAQAPQHHRRRGQPQVRLGLAAAGREEQQVHRLSVRVPWIGEAGQVQQQKRELERPPARSFGLDLVAEPPAQSARHRPVRDPEGVQEIRILAEHRHPVGHAVGRHRRIVEQLLGRLPPRTLQGAALHLAPARLDPAAIAHGRPRDQPGRAATPRRGARGPHGNRREAGLQASKPIGYLTLSGTRSALALLTAGASVHRHAPGVPGLTRPSPTRRGPRLGRVHRAGASPASTPEPSRPAPTRPFGTLALRPPAPARNLQSTTPPNRNDVSRDPRASRACLGDTERPRRRYSAP